MTSSINYLLAANKAARKRRAGRFILLSAACTILLFVFMSLGNPAQLRAQCGGGEYDVCADTCCLTDILSLNTGYNHEAGTVYDLDDQDNYWTITSLIVDGGELSVPRPAEVSERAEYPDKLGRSQWISPLEDPNIFIKQVTYQKCFCICGFGKRDVSFTLNIQFQGHGIIRINGEDVADIQGNGKSQTITFTKELEGPGRHCIEIEIHESRGGLNIQGVIEGEGLVKYNCCGDMPPASCYTDHLQLATNSTWTLVSGPSDFAPYPRCADVITPQWSAWAYPLPGTNWIGANSMGFSGPWHPGYDYYVYRKSFCVAQAGTFTITIQSAADDSGAIHLNGLYLGNTGPYTAHTTQQFVVNLTKGCHCLEFTAVDMGFAITGLNALVDIQGRLLDQCCDCGSCSAQAPQGRSQGHGNHGTSAAPHHAATDMAMNPTLLSIPNPASGETTVHYVLDRNAEARVELYNTAGERVMVVDEGTRTAGRHTVPIITKNLPAGAYRLQLIYGTNNLSVPLNVK